MRRGRAGRPAGPPHLGVSADPGGVGGPGWPTRRTLSTATPHSCSSCASLPSRRPRPIALGDPSALSGFDPRVVENLLMVASELVSNSVMTCSRHDRISSRSRGPTVPPARQIATGAGDPRRAAPVRVRVVIPRASSPCGRPVIAGTATEGQSVCAGDPHRPPGPRRPRSGCRPICDPAPMLSLDGVSKAFGPRTVLSGVSRDRPRRRAHRRGRPQRDRQVHAAARDGRRRGARRGPGPARPSRPAGRPARPARAARRPRDGGRPPRAPHRGGGGGGAARRADRRPGRRARPGGRVLGGARGLPGPRRRRPGRAGRRRR